MNDTRTDRIAMLARELGRLDPPDVRGARRALQRRRDELADMVRRGAAAPVLDVYRYRVTRALDVLRVAEHGVAAAV